MTNHQLQYILDVVLNWSEDRKLAVTQYFIDGKTKYSAGGSDGKYNIYRDVNTVERIYANAFNIINSKDL